MNFETKAMAFMEERKEIEASLKRAIKLFNETNSKSLPLPGDELDYAYSFDKGGAKIEWTEVIYRCGDREEGWEESRIPYEYFASTDSDREAQDRIEEDRRRRKEIETDISLKKRDIERIEAKIRSLTKDKNEFASLKKRYETGGHWKNQPTRVEKNIETEILKYRGLTIIRQQELEELESKLK